MIIIIIFLIWNIFTPAFANGFVLEFKWRRIFSGIQDSSQYFFRSQEYHCLHGLKSFVRFTIGIVIIDIIIIIIYFIVWFFF